MFSDYMLNLHAAKSDTSAERALVETRSAGILDLEEALKPPDLEDALGNHDAHLENAPPLDTSVGALCGVAVGALTHDDVALLVLDLGEEFGQLLDYLLGTTISLWLYHLIRLDRTYPPSPADLEEPRSRARRLYRAR